MILGDRADITDNIPVSIIDIEEQLNTGVMMNCNDSPVMATPHDTDNCSVQNFSVVSPMNSDLPSEYHKRIQTGAMF